MTAFLAFAVRPTSFLLTPPGSGASRSPRPIQGPLVGFAWLLRQVFAFAFLVFSVSAHADAVALEFRAVKVPELIEAVARTILQRDYVIAPDVAASEAKLSLSVKSIDRAAVLDLVRGTLAGVGFAVADRGGVLYFAKEDKAANAAPLPQPAENVHAVNFQSQEVDTDVGFYFPKHRSVEFLSMAARAAGAVVPTVQPNGAAQAATAVQQQQRKPDALVYSGSDKIRARVAKLLAELDRPMGAVTIKAALLEVSAGQDSARSVAAVLSALAGRLGVTLSAGAQQANAITWSGVNLSAVLSAVDGDNHFRYLAEPMLRVVDGETARLIVGTDVPVRGAISTNANGQIIQSIEYRTAGVVLSVSPSILAEVVRLNINQQVSNFSQTTTSGIDSPTMNKREATTVVDARDGDLIVLGGMDEDRDIATASGLAFLPAFLRSSANTKARSQVLLLLEVRRT